MDRRAIEKYAIWARRELRSRLLQRAFSLGISEDGAALDRLSSFWFNRLTALFYLEKNQLLPRLGRLLTDERGLFRPRLSERAAELPEPSRTEALALLSMGKSEEAFRLLLENRRKELKGILPEIGGGLEERAEALFPAGLLREDGILGRMASDIPSEDWTGGPEILGWLFQYYNSEVKDETYAALRKNVKISRERVPAATQLFTPEGVVRFLVENSLGRAWLERGREQEIPAEWKYFAGGLPERSAEEPLRPEDLRVIDPCMGSGHVLSYAFDVLLGIYERAGETRREAVRKILEKNLYGLDIDERAAQLASFALLMKAASVDRSVLRRPPRMNVFATASSQEISEEDIRSFSGGDAELERDLRHVADSLLDAEDLGSLCEAVSADFDGLRERAEAIRESGGLAEKGAAKRLLPVLQTAQALSNRYDAVITNPPYMGAAGMNPRLARLVRERFPDSRRDLFACFLERGLRMAKPAGYSAMVTMQSWMFLSGFEALRKRLVAEHELTALLHMENGVMPIAFGTAASVFRGERRALGMNAGRKALFFHASTENLRDGELLPLREAGIEERALEPEALSAIPGMPVAYWLSDAFREAFTNPPLSSLARPRQGLATGDNERFLRRWQEVALFRIGRVKSPEEAAASGYRWFWYNKGGAYRKWYGNDEYVVDWEHDGERIRGFRDARGKRRSRPQNTEFYFRECFSWSLVTSGRPSFRYKPPGFAFDVAGMSCFADEGLLFLLGLCNSRVAEEALAAIAPTVNFQAGDIGKIPVKRDAAKKERVERLVSECVGLSKRDWDSEESSRDFMRHPLV